MRIFNNNIVNMIEKADRRPYGNVVLDLFKTDEKTEFPFDDKCLNFLYTNGVAIFCRNRFIAISS